MKYILLAAGGSIGTIIRYFISTFVDKQFNSSAFPWGTFLVNISGSLIIGLLAGMMGNNISSGIRLFVFIGLLGGYTTFSSLALEGFTLFNNGQAVIALVYLISSNTIGLLLAAGGYFLGRSLFN